MSDVRVARQEDKEQFKTLWKVCFGDGDNFIDCFFEERFLPEYCVCLEEAGEIVSCMQSYPYHVNIRGKLVAGVMLAGVCTLPEQRGKGYMRLIFTFMMNLLRQKNIVVALHTPAVLESYFSYGHFPVSDAFYVSAAEIPKLTTVSDIKPLKLQAASLTAAFDCYMRNSLQYSGIISRTFADFIKKAEDYGSDGGKCLCLSQEETCLGYCFYYETKEGIQAIEVIADNIDAYERLLYGLCVYYPKLTLLAKLPPEQKVCLSFGKGELKQKAVMGSVNLPRLLSIICGKKGYSIGITDTIVKENQGVFNLAGEAVTGALDIELSAGALTQVIVGYCTLQELKEAGKAVIHNFEHAKEIQQQLQPIPCYIIDEY